MKKTIIYLATIAVLSLSGSAFAQGTAFTYQGRLNNGTDPANGVYDLRFAIYDALGGGAQQGNAITNLATGVTNGVFTVILDFGNQFPGANRWLDVGVRTNGGGAFTPLTPRQQITSTPYAITSANATLASSVSATNVLGILADGHLSGNVALRSGGNAFSGNQAFSGHQTNTAGNLYFDNAQIFVAKNSSGTYENCFYPRWSDNITYLNFGASGFNIRNNTNISAMFFQGDGKVGIGSTSPGLNNLQINSTFHSANGYALQVNKADFGANIQINRGATLGGLGLVLDNSANGDSSTSMLLVRNNVGTAAQTLMDVRTSGVAIGNTTPGFPLNFSTALGDKIALYGNSGNHYGFGIQGNLLQIHADAAASDVAFGWGQSSSFNETMRVRGNGNVGIGTNAPGRLLQVGGLSKEGMIRLASTSPSGPTRVWDIGVPLDNVNTAGKFYSFVIDDTQRGTAPEFLIRWDTGFVGIGTTNPATMLDVAGEITSTAMNLTSDRNEKEEFTPVDARSVLDKVIGLPITEWRYKSQTDARHMGPVAQDFREAFGLGRDDKHITSVDADGVALAAIKGLNEKLEQQTQEKDQRIAELEKEMGQLKEMLTRLAAEKAPVAR